MLKMVYEFLFLARVPWRLELLSMPAEMLMLGKVDATIRIEDLVTLKSSTII